MTTEEILRREARHLDRHANTDTDAFLENVALMAAPNPVIMSLPEHHLAALTAGPAVPARRDHHLQLAAQR